MIERMMDASMIVAFAVATAVMASDSFASGYSIGKPEASRLVGGVDNRICGPVGGCGATGPPFCTQYLMSGPCIAGTEAAPVSAPGPKHVTSF